MLFPELKTRARHTKMNTQKKSPFIYGLWTVKIYLKGETSFWNGQHFAAPLFLWFFETFLFGRLKNLICENSKKFETVIWIWNNEFRLIFVLRIIHLKSVLWNRQNFAGSLFYDSLKHLCSTIWNNNLKLEQWSFVLFGSVANNSSEMLIQNELKSSECEREIWMFDVIIFWNAKKLWKRIILYMFGNLGWFECWRWIILLWLGSRASDGGDVEFVIPSLLAIEHAERSKFGNSFLFQDDLEGCLAVMFIGDPKRANLAT